MITNHNLKQELYDIIVEKREIKMVKREDGNEHGNYGIEVTLNPTSTMTYFYTKREDRDNDFEEVTKFKEIYNEQLGK